MGVPWYIGTVDYKSDDCSVATVIFSFGSCCSSVPFLGMGVLDGNSLTQVALRILVSACQLSFLPLKFALIQLYFFISSWKPFHWLDAIPPLMVKSKCAQHNFFNPIMP